MSAAAMPSPPPSPAPCTVRLAQPEDVPVLCLLKWQFAVDEGSTFVVRATPEEWMRDMFGPQARLSAEVAETGGIVIGMAIITERFCAGWAGSLFAIDDVFVVPEHRGRGVGRALLAGAARHAIARGAPFVELTVREDNEPAIRLYRRVGFERVPGTTFVLAGDALAALIEGAPDGDGSPDEDPGDPRLAAG